MRFLVGLVVATLVLQIVIGQDATCGDRTTAINSPWIFSESDNCPDLISSVPDYYNEIYLSECQRQMGGEKPVKIEQAIVNECYDMKNGTVKYKVTICCPGTLQDQRCFVCSNVSVEYDSHRHEYLTYRCNHLDTVETCPSGQVCATVYNYVAGRHVDKMCMDGDVCAATALNNSLTCRSYIPKPSCTYCCDTPLCNYYQSMSYRTPGKRPQRCYNGGEIIEDDTVDAGYRCNCTDAFYGDQCSSSQCSRYPCENGGQCSRTSSTPYYACYCKVGWRGVNCSEAYDLCNSTYEGYCRNNGVCFDHGEYGPRCKCPEGFHGTNCELEVLGASRCSSPDLYYAISSIYSGKLGLLRCTNRSEYYVDHTSYKKSYGSSCTYWMRQGYRVGIDGGEATAVESMDLHRCESGDLYSWYSYDFCCPSCTRKPCQNGGWCIQKGVDFVCRCRLGYGGDRCQFKEALCLVSGDPHILTFDNKNLHPQGICKYNLASSSASANLTIPFNVDAKFERRGDNNLVSYVKYVDVSVYGHNLRLDRNHIIRVDGDIVDPLTSPVYAEGKLKVAINGNFMRIETDFGLVVENDGQWTAVIKVPTDFENATEGLCGNNDGDAENDMLTKEGNDVTGMNGSQSVLANSWQVHDPDGQYICQKEVVDDIADCDTELKTELSKDNHLCGLSLITNTNPFKTCLAHPQMNAQAFADNCIFDVCVWRGNEKVMKEAACGTLSALALQCKNLGLTIDWRDMADCPYNCSGGQVYTVSGSPCTVTCKNPDAVTECGLPNAETCVCPTGTVFHNGVCQNKSVCEIQESYSFGDWSKWMCTSAEEQVRERECYRTPGNETVDSELCVGINEEVREIEADCFQCDGVENGMGYLSHDCDEEAFWVCEWIQDDWQATKMTCGACTKWSQADLTCIHSDDLCGMRTTTQDATQVPPQANDDDCVPVGGSVYRTIPNKPNSYMWILEDGRQFETQCASGTTFDVITCGCVLDQVQIVQPVAPAASDELTCLDFSSVGRWGFSASKWKWVSNVGPVTLEADCGVDGSCAYFDGSSQLEIGHFKQRSNRWSQLDHFSISLWFKKEASVSDTEYLIRYGYCDEEDSIVMRVESDTSVGGGINTPSGSYMDAFTSIAVSENEWHHLVMVFDSTSGELQFYVDGAMISRRDVEGVLQYRYCNMVIGNLFKGYMDEVCFYASALSQAEVLSLYQVKG